MFWLKTSSTEIQEDIAEAVFISTLKKVAKTTIFNCTFLTR